MNDYLMDMLHGAGLSHLVGGTSSDHWVVAIPSYNRPDVVRKKTLQCLKDGKVPASRIFVFVVKEQLEEYQNAVPKELYNKMIVGKKGLVNQRQFINDYFKKGQDIVCMDDDIRGLVKLVPGRDKDNPLNNTTKKVVDLVSFFDMAFRVMKEKGANIWGMTPSANPRFMRNVIKTNLSYIVGAFYGIRNTKDPAYVLKYGDNQEDKERTARYFQKDGVVVRFGAYAPVTTYFAPGGLESPTRKKDTKKYTDILVEKFPDYFTQIYKPSFGIYDLRFKRGEGTKSEIEGGAERSYYTEDKDDVSIKTHSIRNPSKYKEARDELLEILRDTTLPKLGKPKTGEHTRANKIGSIGRTMTFGYGDTRHGVKDYKKNTDYPELFHALVKFGNQVVPKGWDYNGITLNEGVKAKKHKDSKNLGVSYIVGIGDFTDGGIKVWNADDKDPKVLDLHDRPVSFNGGLLYHQTAPFKGERYTMVFYRQMWKGKPKGVSMIGRGEAEEIETGGIFA